MIENLFIILLFYFCYGVGMVMVGMGTNNSNRRIKGLRNQDRELERGNVSYSIFARFLKDKFYKKDVGLQRAILFLFLIFLTFGITYVFIYSMFGSDTPWVLHKVVVDEKQNINDTISVAKGVIKGVTIGEIIDHPYKYNNKVVILKVKYAGWECPPGKISYPSFLSRSASFWYDNTGCIYGGKIVRGRLMIPKWHTSAEKGNETVWIEGRVRVDKEGKVWLENP